MLVFDSRLVTTVEHFRNPAYNVWVMLMGGPSRPVRQTSIRLFLAGFVLNALVIRTMYHSAMFERLQATTTLGSDLNTFQQINAAHMLYYMYITTSFYYKDNPLVHDRYVCLTGAFYLLLFSNISTLTFAHHTEYASFGTKPRTGTR